MKCLCRQARGNRNRPAGGDKSSPGQDEQLQAALQPRACQRQVQLQGHNGRILAMCQSQQDRQPHLWAAVLPRLNVVCEVLVGPAGIAKINDFAADLHQALLQRGRGGSLLPLLVAINHCSQEEPGGCRTLLLSEDQVQVLRCHRVT